MKKIIMVLLTIILLVSTTTIVYANDTTSVKTVTIPEDMLTEEQKIELQKQETLNKIKQYGNWVGLGKEIGTAVDESLGALTNRAEEFANTKVGAITLFIVLYKVCGTDFIQLIVGSSLLIFMITIWLISFYKNCIPHRVVVQKEGWLWKSKKTYEIIGIDNSYGGSQRWSYTLVLGLIIAFCSIIIFA
jgi:hypothetical protein